MAQVLPDSLLARVSQALEQREPERAFALLTPYSARLTDDPELASTWLTLLRITPSRAGLRGDVERVLSRWPERPELVTAACDALIRAAELAPPDEPPPSDGGPAELAVKAAERCLASLPEGALRDARVGGYLHTCRANALRLLRRYEEAADACKAALDLAPENGGWWFNLGLVYKGARDFHAALEANERARSLLGDQKGVLWNIALCATALGLGELAAGAMKKLGFPAQVSSSGMPFVDGLPPVQVRAATLGSGHGVDQGEIDRAVVFELLWVSPLSPCHGVVQTTTFREASVDYGDLVLWDGTPVGVIQHEGKPVPRFPLLSVLRKGEERIFRFVALEQEEGDLRRFGEGLPMDARLFSHRARVELLCARCASGDHMRKHEHMPPEPHRLVYGKLVVPAGAALAELHAALDARLRDHPSVQLVMPALLEALGETQAAGKAHQMWRGLERTALKTKSSPA